MDEDQLMNKGSTDIYPVMDKASTDKHPSMDKDSTYKTCLWICLIENYPLTATSQYEDKMTENKNCRV